MYREAVDVEFSFLRGGGWDADDPDRHVIEIKGSILLEEKEIGTTNWSLFHVSESRGGGCFDRSLFDAHSEEALTVHEQVLRNAKAMEAIDVDPEYLNFMLFGRGTELVEEQRGYGYGLQALGLALQTFAGDATSNGIVVISPAPILYPKDEIDEGAPAWVAMRDKLRAHWAQAGFTQVGDTGFYALNPDYKHPWNTPPTTQRKTQ